MSDLILDNSNDPRSLFRLINKMLSSSKDNILPDHQSGDELKDLRYISRKRYPPFTQI